MMGLNVDTSFVLRDSRHPYGYSSPYLSIQTQISKTLKNTIQTILIKQPPHIRTDDHFTQGTMGSGLCRDREEGQWSPEL